jgi:uncharacterized protein (TIGR02466 family)
MSNGNIHMWFPKTLYVLDNLLIDQLLKFEEEIKIILQSTNIKRTGTLNVDSTHQYDDSIHDNLVFKDLVSTIYENSKLYLKELGYNEKFVNSLSIENMWANVSKSGDFLFPHVHPNSLLSGVFYIKTGSNNTITFFDDIHNMNVPSHHDNSLNFSTCDYDCEPGRMILFRSNFLHGTKKQSDGEKIVISFNIG